MMETVRWSIKGLLSCKMHFLMSFIHNDVPPVCQQTHKVPESATVSHFLRTRISKNGGTRELVWNRGPIPIHRLYPTPTHYPSVCAFARRVRPHYVLFQTNECGGGVGYQAKQRVCIGADFTCCPTWPDSTLCVSVRKQTVYKQFLQTFTDKLRC